MRVEVVGLRRSYGRLNAIDGVDLVVESGSRHALIGCNGAGKTTLLHVLAGTIRPTAGRIRYGDKDITGWSPAARSRAGIARTFQAPALFDSQTVLDNLLLAGWPHDRRWGRGGRRAGLRAAALDRLDRLGIADQAAVPAGRLPHGRRRLVEIAMALVARPRLLLLDEPAAGLTDDDTEQLVSALGALPAELTVVLVEHHQDVVAELADTVTVLHDGVVIASGSHAQVAADPEVVRVYLGTGMSA